MQPNMYAENTGYHFTHNAGKPLHVIDSGNEITSVGTDEVSEALNLFAVLTTPSTEYFFQSTLENADIHVEEAIQEVLYQKEDNQILQNQRRQIYITSIDYKIKDTGEIIAHIGEARTEIIIQNAGKTDEGDYIYDLVTHTTVDLSSSMPEHGGSNILTINNYYNVDDSLKDIEGYEGDLSTQTLISCGPETGNNKLPHFTLDGETQASNWSYGNENVRIREFSNTDAVYHTEISPATHNEAGRTVPWEVASGIRFISEYEAYEVKVENYVSIYVYDIWNVFYPTVNCTITKNTLNFITDDGYRNISQLEINAAYTDLGLITSSNQLYYREDLSPQLPELVRILIASEYFSLDGKKEIYKKIRAVKLVNDWLTVYDALGEPSFLAYNFEVDDKGQTIQGYLVFPVSFRSEFVRKIAFNRSLPTEATQIYLLDDIYYKATNGQYQKDDGTVVSAGDFTTKENETIDNYFNYTLQELSHKDLLRKQTWNQIISLLTEEDTYLGSTTDYTYQGWQYDGQEGFGYGGIYDCSLYLSDRYGAEIISVTGDRLPMYAYSPYTLEDLSATDGNNCTIGAVTRLMSYEGRLNIPFFGRDPFEIYPIVRNRAVQHGYHPSLGTLPVVISSLIETSARDVGRSNVRSRGVYIWDFKSEVVDQINAYKMPIMNILRGYYENHSVAVIGYRIYKTKVNSRVREFPMIAICDGWTDGNIKYIDYMDFAYNFVYAGIGSFNTIYYV